MTLLSLLQENQPLFLITVLLFSLAVGSFLNVVIFRLPKMMASEWRTQCRELLDIEQEEAPSKKITLSKPASTCPHCGHKIRA